MDSGAVDCDPVRMADPASLRRLAAGFEWLGDPRYARRCRNRADFQERYRTRREPVTPKAERPRCGATTRKGTPCRAPVVWNATTNTPQNGRCRLHGGLSTGARTEEGREACIRSNRRRGILRRLAACLPDSGEEERRRLAEAVLLRAEGYSLRETGARLGFSHETVRRWLTAPGMAEVTEQTRERVWMWELRRHGLR